MFFLVAVLICIHIYGTYAFGISINENRSGLIGSNGTTLECLYNKEEKDDVLTLYLLYKNTTSDIYEEIVVFRPRAEPQLTLTGQYLLERVHLQNDLVTSSRASMTFYKIQCIDDAAYKCRITYLDQFFQQYTVESEATTINVQALPTKPDGITYFIMSTNSTQPEEHTTQSVNNNSSIVKTEGDSVTFVCSGVVGKPPEQFIFHKFHQGHVLVKNYTHVTTHSYLIDGMCNFYGTSYLTMQVTRHDDQAIIRCTVDFVLADLYEESDLVQVLYPVRMPTIIKYPNKTEYVLGEDTSLHLTCKSDGNPKPSCYWYKENPKRQVSSNENLTITNMNITDNGTYTCETNNTVHGKTYQKAAIVKIRIINADDIPTTQSSSTCRSACVDKKEEKSKGLVAGIVGAGVAVVVVVTVIIACTCKRKNKSPTFTNVSNSFGDSNPKPVTEPRTGDYDYIALEDDPPKAKSSNDGLEVEDIKKQNEEYLKKQEEEEKKKNNSNTPPQPAVYASKLKNKQKTETPEKPDKQEEDPYAETQEGVYDQTGNPRHKENKDAEQYDVSSNSSKQNSNGDNKLSIQTSQVGSYANQGFEKDENRKVATVSPTVRSSSGSQNDEETNSNRNSQSKKGYENIIGTDQTGIPEDESSHRTAL